MKGQELKQWRAKAQLTQAQLAERLGVTSNTIARWERDEVSIPTHVNAAAISKSPQSYLARVMSENNLTAKQVSERATKLRYRLSAATIHGLLNGSVTNPGVYTVQALAVGLGRPEGEAFEAFGVRLSEQRTADDSELEAIQHNYKHLSDETRRRLRPTLKMLSREIQHLLREELSDS